ncbi:MAG: tetratricopeptide repeat protein, partial [Halobacteriovoraceae bacterium]|nr:tetratricopeptide repeat protein [Halobacteriovoraceae bacterium]
IKPKDISIRFEHAHFLIKNLQYQLAEKEFWKMLELDKKNHLINFEYALLLDKMKNRADNAITQYNNVILVKPENRIARYNLARNYERVKLWKEAKQHYQIVLVKDPRHYPANIRLGIIARKENKDQLAFKHFDKAIAANPKVILPYEEKALILTKQEKYDLAAAQYELLIGQHKNYARAYVFKGWLFEKLGELKNAEGQYKKAVRLDKDSDYSARNLKEFYLRKKKKK